MTKRTISCLLLAVSSLVAGPSITLPLSFERNIGQTGPDVKYLTRGHGGTLWLTDQGPVLGIAEKSRLAVLRLRFEGGQPSPTIEGVSQTDGVSNYFIGNDASKWRTGVPQFKQVRYRDVYPGIDVVFYGNDHNLEYDFVLRPGADPRRIRLTYSGAEHMRIDPTGDLVLTIGSSEIRQHPPKIYQGMHTIEGHYAEFGRNRIGFSIARYDRSLPLTIDPVMTYATYLGGATSSDSLSSLAMDAQGNLYVCGLAGSLDFPKVGGLGQPGPAPQTTAFVAKINPGAFGAASLVWSTFLGSPNFGTEGGPIAVDAGGNVYVGGATQATDFPIRNGFQSTANCNIPGATNCFAGWIAKIAPLGNQLLYSSYLGGGIIDLVTALTVDAAGNAYVAGNTQSPFFPMRGSPFQTRLTGHQNATLSKISADGSTLVYSTYFGGEASESISSIFLDSKGLVYLGGLTTSIRYPLTPNAYQTSLQSNSIAGMVAVFDLTQPSSSALVYSTYLAGPAASNNRVNAVAADSTGAILVAGSTTDANFPVTASAFQSKFGGVVTNDPNGATGDAFVARLNPAAQGLAQLTYSSFLGGSGNDAANAIAVDSAGRIAVAGTTGSSNLPTTVDAFECCFSNPANLNTTGFLARIDPSKSGASSLLYSSYLGGSGGTVVLHSLALNNAGTVAAAAGDSLLSNAPVTSSAFQKQIRNGARNPYVARFDLSATGPLISQYENGGGLAAMPSAKIAPGLVFTVKGNFPGPVAASLAAIDPATGRLATNIEGVQVLVNGIACPLVYVSTTQINAIAPYELAGTSFLFANVQVVVNNVPGNVMFAPVAPVAPAILSFGDGTGQGAILNQDQSINGSQNAAARGTIVTIFATGEGQTNPPGVTGGLATDLNNLPHPVASLTVSIGNVPATNIQYAGTAPLEVYGLLQVNVAIPAGVTPGPAVPVVIAVGGVSSQAGLTMAVK